MKNKYFVESCFSSKNAAPKSEISINGKVYRNGVVRTEFVTKDILETMLKGQKNGWFKVKILREPENENLKEKKVVNIVEPEVTEPEVTEPEVTEPEVTEPEVTEPEVTVDLSSMKKAELIAFAEEKGINVPADATVAVLKETIAAAL